MKILHRGAESILYIENNSLVKERIQKSYRLKEIDEKLRRYRTRQESRLLEKSSKIINTPTLLKTDENNMKLEMEYIKGSLLKDILDKLSTKERLEICRQIGQEIFKLHQANIIHGDLTTSNMILRDNKIYLIDFGLGFISTKIEDKAVDLHLLKQALESKHYQHFQESLQAILKSYNNKEVLERLEKVEKRGRYKNKSLSTS